MPPEPKFSELQKVAPTPGPDSDAWVEGFVIGTAWREAGLNNATGEPYAAGWIYKIQTGPNRDLVDIWWPEEKLEARR